MNNSNADKHDTRCKTCCQGYEKEKRAKKRRILEPTVAEKTCRHVVATLHPARSVCLRTSIRYRASASRLWQDS